MGTPVTCVERQAVFCVAPGGLCSSAPHLAISEVSCQHSGGGTARTARAITASKACATIAAGIATDDEGLNSEPAEPQILRRS